MSNTISAQTGTMNLLPGEEFNVAPLLDSLITLQSGSLNFTLSNVAAASGQIIDTMVGGQPAYDYIAPGTLANAGQLTDTISFTATDYLGDSVNDTVNVATNDSEQWTDADGNNDPTDPGNWEQQVSGSFTLPGYVPDANTTADVTDFAVVGGVGIFLPVAMTLPTGENLSVGQVSAVDLAFSNAGIFNINGPIGPFLTSFANSGTINGINGQFYDSGAADNYGMLNIAGSLAVAYGTLVNPGGAGGSITLDNHVGASIVAAPTATQPNVQLAADNIDNAGTIDLATPGSTDLTSTGNVAYGVLTNEAGGLVEMQGGSNYVNVGALLNQGSLEMDCSGSSGLGGTSYLNVGALSGASTLPGGLAFDNESQITLTGGTDSTVEIFGDGVNNGSVTENAGGNGLTCETTSGTLTNNGAWTMNSGDAGEFDASTLINNGSISLSGKEFSIFTNQLTNTATGTVSLTILPGEGSYEAAFETPVTNDGEIDIAANSRVAFEGATNGSAADTGSIHLAAGATLEVADGAWGWTVSTGSIGANQSIWLDGGDDRIEIGNFPNNTIAAPIHGFAEGDAIVLSGVSFLDVGLNFDQSTDMLTVNLAGGGTQTFQFASPIPAADHFVAIPDPTAGVDIVLAPALGILDLVASQTGVDTALSKPFTSAVLEDVNTGATLTLTITLDNPANGVLTNLSGGSYDPASGVYTIAGGLQQLSGALSQLSFLATAGSSATTNFTVSVSDGSYGNTASASTSLAVTGAAGDVPPAFMLSPGDVFTSPVNAQAYGLTTLDLMPGAGATLSGLGSNFVGFTTIDVQTGANWQLTGSNTLTAGESITGGGTLSVAAGATLATCANGGETIGNAVILNDGTMEIDVNDPAVIGASLAADPGDSGLVDIMAGGSLELDGSVAASQTIAFTADSGRLTIADPAQFLASVAGPRQGDAIDFSSFAWGSVSGVSTATPGEIVLNLTGGGSYSLALAAGTNLSQTTLALGNDGHGGTELYFGSAATPIVTLASNPLATNASPAILGSAAAGYGSDALSVQLTSDADYSTGSSVSLVNGNLLYTPGTVTNSGSDTISYTVTDTVTGAVTSETQTVAINPTSLTILASFDGANGENPFAGVITDSAGDLFGTTSAGGAYLQNNQTNGTGTVFEIKAGSNNITALASFNGNGGNPTNALIADAAGNLFGASWDGTVFEVKVGSNAITTLAAFDGSNGTFPYGGLVADAAGDLFGTTEYGGAIGGGVVFEVKAGSNSITTLASFDGSNGSAPYAALTADSTGDLFGTTSTGGASGDGTTFEIVAGSDNITTLANFNGSNGSEPDSGLLVDDAGDLFGTTDAGGASGDGTAFEIKAGTGSITTLVSFNGTNGSQPTFSGLTADTAGNLFGTTLFGGTNNLGVVFEISNSGFVPFSASSPVPSIVNTIVNLSGQNDTVVGPSTPTPPSGNSGAAIDGPAGGFATTTGTANNITINAYGYDNTIVAGGGNDTINAGLDNANVTVSNSDGDNIVTGSEGYATITLGDGNDTITAGGYGNKISLGNGDNTVSAGVGLEQVGVGNGNNTVATSGYNNTITIGDGTNTISAGVGNETITVGGGAANITASGYYDSFTLDGGATTITGLTGFASINLASSFGASDSVDLAGFSGQLVDVGGAWTAEKPDGEVYASFSLPSGEILHSSSDGNGGMLIQTGAGPAPAPPPPPAPATAITETSGNQTVALASPTTTLHLWGYDNTVSSASGGFSIDGDDGYSTFTLAGDGNTLALGGYGDTIDIGVNALGASIATGGNTIGGTVGSTTVVIGNGDQSITLGGYYNHVATGVGDSTINAGVGDSSVTVAGGDNAITVTGNQNVITTGAGTDTVALGNGWNNTIHAGSGTTTVTGGYGNTYVAGVGTLDVTDFNAAYGDVLDLRSLETALGVTGSAFSVAADTTTPTSLDVFVAQGASTSLLATLGGTHGTLASLEASHSILA